MAKIKFKHHKIFYVVFLKNIILIFFKNLFIYGLFHSAPNALLTAALIYYNISELSEDESEDDESEDDELLLYINSCN